MPQFIQLVQGEFFIFVRADTIGPFSIWERGELHTNYARRHSISIGSQKGTRLLPTEDVNEFDPGVMVQRVGDIPLRKYRITGTRTFEEPLLAPRSGAFELDFEALSDSYARGAIDTLRGPGEVWGECQFSRIGAGGEIEPFSKI
jgi:hypothetical protein